VSDISEIYRQLGEIRCALEGLGRCEPRRLLTVDDIAGLLQVSRRTVEEIISRGELRPIRIGRLRRIHPDTLEAFIRHQERAAA
jgi:excisionase family DNA binding protein